MCVCVCVEEGGAVVSVCDSFCACLSVSVSDGLYILLCDCMHLSVFVCRCLCTGMG